MASLGRHLSAGGLGTEPDAPAAMDIEEGYWQALRPDLKGQTQVGSMRGADGGTQHVMVCRVGTWALQDISLLG